jgi:hypothetical protein
MEVIRVQQVVTKDGEIVVKDLPYKKGQHVTLLIEPVVTPPRPHLTVRQLRQSGLIGMWKDREDIQDSAIFARQLRDKAQTRSR